MKGPWLRLVLSMALAGLLVAGWLYLRHIAPIAQSDMPPIHISPTQFQTLYGETRLEENGLVVRGCGQRQCLITVYPGALDTSTIRYLRYRLDADRPTEERARFFWRRDLETRIDTAEIDSSPIGILDLGRQDNWRGQVSELGFLFPRGTSQHWTLNDVSLQGPAPMLGTLALLGNWSGLELWSQRSVNQLFGSRGTDLPSLQQVVLLWIILSLTLLLLFSWANLEQPSTGALLTLLLAGWLLLDLRWLATLWRHAEITWNTFGNRQEEEKYRAAIEAEQFDLYQRVRQRLQAEQPAEILLPQEIPPEMAYFYAKAPYFLAPHRVLPLGKQYRRGYLIVLNGIPADYDPQHKSLRLGRFLLEGVEPVERHPAGTLYYITPQ